MIASGLVYKKAKSILGRETDMSEAEKIYVDVSQPATLRYGTKLIDCPTVGEAVLAFDRLPEGDREQATIKVNVPGAPLTRRWKLIDCTLRQKERCATRRGASRLAISLLTNAGRASRAPLP